MLLDIPQEISTELLRSHKDRLETEFFINLSLHSPRLNFSLICLCIHRLETEFFINLSLHSPFGD